MPRPAPVTMAISPARLFTGMTANQMNEGTGSV
jgi:hypothetical protein